MNTTAMCLSSLKNNILFIDISNVSLSHYKAEILIRFPKIKQKIVFKDDSCHERFEMPSCPGR